MGEWPTVTYLTKFIKGPEIRSHPGLHLWTSYNLFIFSLGSVFLYSSKTGLVTTAWDRLFFFTQGGNLMCQPRGAVAGGMVLDLDNSSVMAVDCEDRRYCFQITSPSGKMWVHMRVNHKHVEGVGCIWFLHCLSLQVNDPTSWEQEGIWRSKHKTVVLPSLFIYIFISVMSAGIHICQRTMWELSRLIYAVYIFAFVLEHISHN